MKISYTTCGKTGVTSLRELLKLLDQLCSVAVGHASLTVHYNGKHLHIYHGSESDCLGLEFVGPGVLDGSSCRADVATVKEALKSLSEGKDPKEYVQSVVKTWTTYREYEGLS